MLGFKLQMNLQMNLFRRKVLASFIVFICRLVARPPELLSQHYFSFLFFNSDLSSKTNTTITEQLFFSVYILGNSNKQVIIPRSFNFIFTFLNSYMPIIVFNNFFPMATPAAAHKSTVMLCIFPFFSIGPS